MSESGCSYRFIGFTRNNYPSATDGVEVTILGLLAHRRYISRMVSLLRSLPRIRREARRSDVVYCFSLDALLIGRIASLLIHRPIVYQVQDVRSILIGDQLKNKLFRCIERRLLRCTGHLVVSSQAYYEHHFKVNYGLKRSRVSVVENKLELAPASTDKPAQHSRTRHQTITIGYFGILRCPRSWKVLTTAVQRQSERIQLLVRGKPSGIPGFLDDVDQSQSIRYGGTYRDPDELAALYGPVDLVWAAYPYSYGKRGNWEWARTVRFYEACAHNRPVVVQAGTEDARVVLEHNIGMVLDLSDVNRAVNELLSITTDRVTEWRHNLEELPREMFVHSDEYQRLRVKLVQLLAGKPGNKVRALNQS